MNVSDHPNSHRKSWRKCDFLSHCHTVSKWWNGSLQVGGLHNSVPQSFINYESSTPSGTFSHTVFWAEINMWGPFKLFVHLANGNVTSSVNPFVTDTMCLIQLMSACCLNNPFCCSSASWFSRAQTKPRRCTGPDSATQNTEEESHVKVFRVVPFHGFSLSFLNFIFILFLMGKITCQDDFRSYWWFWIFTVCIPL